MIVYKHNDNCNKYIVNDFFNFLILISHFIVIVLKLIFGMGFEGNLKI